MRFNFYRHDHTLPDGARVTAWVFQILFQRMGADGWKYSFNVTWIKDRGK